MTYKFLLLSFLILSCLTYSITAQGYFVASAGTYISSDNFKTNVQSDISKYEGRYIAASETYESNYEYIITMESDDLMVTMISGATMDGGDNWMIDTVIFRNVIVSGGEFTILDIPANFGNPNFRFVQAEYKVDGKSIISDGLVMEEYLMFGEKE